MKLTGTIVSIGRHELVGESVHGVLVEVPREQLQQGGILYREVQVETVEPKPAISAAEAEQALRGGSEQSPSCCPFCGAARKPACRFEWFKCGTMTAPADNNRRDQTPTCATAERERLTREKDEFATKATEMAFRVAELTRELESHAHDLSPAMVQARNDQLNAENAELLARVKRLEEAGDELEAFCSAEGAIRRWRKAKEAKP